MASFLAISRRVRPPIIALWLCRLDRTASGTRAATHPRSPPGTYPPHPHLAYTHRMMAASANTPAASVVVVALIVKDGVVVVRLRLVELRRVALAGAVAAAVVVKVEVALLALVAEDVRL